MLQIIRFESKKIVYSKLTITMILIGVILIIYSFTSNALNYKAHDENGNLIKGYEAVKEQKSQYKKVFDKIQTDDEIITNLRILNKNYDAEMNKTGFEVDKALPKDIYYNFYKPREAYFDWIVDNYSSIHGGDYESLHSLMAKIDNLPDFYIERGNKISEKLEEHPFRKYSTLEKGFWYKKANSTKGPYRYGFYEGWSQINGTLDIFLFLLLAIGVGVCGVFSKEHETGADAIILSSKYGKSKVIVGKIIAALIFTITVVLLGLLICILPCLLYYGIDGWDLPIQILSTKILYNWSFLELIIVRSTIFSLVALFISAISLFLSSTIKRTTPTVIMVTMIIFGSIFIPNLDNKLYGMIVGIFPVQINAALYYDTISYPIFGKVFTVYGFATIIYLILSLILYPLSGKMFKSHQVK